MAVEQRLEAEVALGNHASAVPELRERIREHPTREDLQRLLMLALYRSGRQADALAVYRDAREVLVGELGLDPSEALQQLEAAILAHDRALNLPVEAGAARLSTGVAPESPGAARLSTGVAPESPGAVPAPAADSAAGPTRRAVRRPRIGRKAAVLAGAITLASISACIVAVLPVDHAGSRLTTLSANSVGFITADGDRVSTRLAITGEPTSVAVGAGAIWVVETTAGMVARVDPILHSVVQMIPVGADPSGITSGGGSVWVANHDDNSVSRISPETNTVVETVPVGAGPVAVAYGYGSVWVTNDDDRTLTRVDAVTGKVVTTVRTNAVGRGVAVGGGAVWITDEATNRIVGVDPATNAVTSTTTVGTGPTAIAYGDGAVWVVNALDGTVSQVDGHTFEVRSTISVSGGPSAISFAAGSVWVSAEFAFRVLRIDAVRGVIASSTSIGNRPQGLVATSAGVWVAAAASGAGHRGGRLVVIGSGIGSIDPGTGDIIPELNEPVYDALTGLRRASGSAGMQIVPDLATALPQPTADATSYTFHLRPQIRYSDGRLLQGADFRRALERLVKNVGAFASSFSHIIGADDCTERSRCDLSRGVLVDGTSTITFRLSTPDPRFFENLLYLIPVPAGTPTSEVTTTPVPGTGPYAIQSYVPGRLLTFERNRYFHVWSQAARPDGYPDEIVYRVVADHDDALHQLLAGHADLVQLQTEPSALSQLSVQHPGQVHLEEQQSIVFMFLNTRRPPFDDIRVRQALNYAVDRARVVELYGAAISRPTCQVVPPTATGYRPYCPYTVEPDPQGRWHAPDLVKAQSLVDASRTKGQHVVVWTASKYAAEASYAAALLGHLGYRASVHEIADPDTYFDTLDKTPDAQAGMFGWFGTPLAVDMLSTLTCGFDLNPAHFCNPKIDSQIRQLAREEPTNPADTLDLAADVDREIMDEAPWVPLVTPRSVDVTSTRTGNYQTQSGQVLLDQFWVT